MNTKHLFLSFTPVNRQSSVFKKNVAMPMIVALLPYSGLTELDKKNNWFWLTTLWQSLFSVPEENDIVHAELILFEQRISVRSDGRYGTIIERGIRSFAKKRHWEFYMLPTARENDMRFLQFCEKHKNKPYNFIGIVMSPIISLSGNDEKFTCIELIMRGFQESGILPSDSDIDPVNTLPCDIKNYLERTEGVFRCPNPNDIMKQLGREEEKQDGFVQVPLGGLYTRERVNASPQEEIEMDMTSLRLPIQESARAWARVYDIE
jgi:hypothetical protein